MMTKLKTIKPRRKTQAKASTSAVAARVAFSATIHDKDNKEALKKLLTQSLAAYVVLNSRKPMADVMTELFDLEYKAARMVTAYFNDEKNINLRGALAAVYSVIPIGKSPKAVRQMMLEQKPKAKPRRPTKKKHSRK